MRDWAILIGLLTWYTVCFVVMCVVMLGIVMVRAG